MNIIEKYQFGKIIVSGYLYQTDIIVFPDHIQENWRRKDGHQLKITDLDTIIVSQPDVLIIGTGMYGLMKIEDSLLKKLKALKIKNVIVEKTKKACELYNKEKSSKKVAALHLTC